MIGLGDTIARARQLDDTGSSGAELTTTISANASQIWVIEAVHIAYSHDPATGGLFTIDIGGSTYFEEGIETVGVKEFLFPGGLYGNINETITFTLGLVLSSTATIGVVYR